MKKMKRIALFVLDGAGIGALPDAAQYGDEQANTLLHTYQKTQPAWENLLSLGLGSICREWPDAYDDPIACYGRMAERSVGKDTTSGHWELAGLPLRKPFPTYPNGFPPEVIRAFEEAVGMEVIGNKPASGTAIIEELGPEHIRTGKLIVYTSADSVFQIAAHEAIIPPTELWHICRVARQVLVGEHAVGRVIARPFIGNPGSFVRTANRKDFSIDPIGDTMLDVLKAEGYDVIGIGKIEDIFNHRGLTQSNHTSGNADCIEAALELLKKDYWNGLLFVNLVDTDMLYGHRRDVKGFADAIEDFDSSLGQIIQTLDEDSLLMIVADHGCDPTHVGTDHTREYAPLLVWGLGIEEGVNLGTRGSFADVSATILEALGAKRTLEGKSFYKQLLGESL